MLALKELLETAIEEDAPTGDITTEYFVGTGKIGQARLISKAEGIFYGEEIITALFEILDQSVKISFSKHNGNFITSGDVIAQFEGSIPKILLAERVMLNFVQRLSGIATLTNQFVTKLNNSKISILDTRKTTPLFRSLERKAVIAGGAQNHRFGLSDMVLLKENHLRAMVISGEIKKLSEKIKVLKQKKPWVQIEIEIENLTQLQEWDLKEVNMILLDNFKLDEIAQAVNLAKHQNPNVLIEISGNVTLENIAQYRNFPIDRISVGALTHSARALDLSLRFD